MSSSGRIRNLETYSVVIFSQNLGLLDEFQINIRKIIDNQDDVKNYIEKNNDDLIILIISIEFAETIIKCTHDLKQLQGTLCVIVDK